MEDKGYPSAGVAPGEVTIERKIVKTGHITLEVEDIVEAIDEIAEVADELGGYVVSSHKSEGEKRTSGSIRIRVPADRFDEAFDRLRQLAISVPYESTEARDVTEEYIDLQARLHNLEATEAQYLALLEKAETVEDMLKVQRELSNVRGEIEQIEGRIKYLERTSDMSLIEVTLEEAKGLAEPWSASNALKSAVRGLTAFGRGLATVVIWLGIFCWAWVPPLVIWLRRRRKKA
jgi:DNA repair exonuclease SbcCD ATPase subunit